MDDGVIGVAIMRKFWVKTAGVFEYLESEVEILLSSDHGDQAFWVEAFRPRFDWGCDGREGTTGGPDWQEEGGGDGDLQLGITQHSSLNFTESATSSCKRIELIVKEIRLLSFGNQANTQVETWRRRIHQLFLILKIYIY